MLSRRAMLAVVLALAFSCIASGSAVTGNTRGPTWLLSTAPRVFCAGVPSIATMEIIKPSTFTPPCKQSGYVRALAPVWVGPLLAIVFTVVALVITCASLVSKRSSSTFSSGGMYISVNSSFLEKSKEAPMIGLAVIGLVALIGMVVALVGSDQVHALITNVQQIFRANYEYVDTTLATAVVSMSGMSNATELGVVVDLANAGASVYKDNSDYVMGGFTTLDRLRTTLLIVTALVVAFTTIGGAISISLRWSRLLNCMIISAFVAMILVFVNVLVYTLAANVISDMCMTINPCHFCYVNGGSNCGELCSVPWFAAMNNCPEAAQVRFAPITNFADAALNVEGAAVCEALGNLCSLAGLGCAHQHQCGTHNLRAYGLSTAVCVPATAPNNCSTVSALQTAPWATHAMVAAAGEVVNMYANFQSWSDVYSSLKTLNCAEASAFIESVPLGTYNLLQQTLCPRIVNPANPPQQSFAVIVIGLQLTAATLPFVICLLCSSKKKPRMSGAPSERSSLLSR